MIRPGNKQNLWKWIVLVAALVFGLSRGPGLFVKVMSAPNFESEASRIFLQDRIALDWSIIAVTTIIAAIMAYLIWFRRT